MHTFGCACFVHLPPHEHHKLSAQSVKCTCMGYSASHKGYVCYDPCSNRFRISRHVIFFENQFLFSTHVESSPESLVFLSFNEVNTTIERFKHGFVYTRQCPTLQPPELDSTSEPVQTVSSTDNQPSNTTVCRSFRIIRPPNQYRFHTSLHTTFTSVSIPSCYSEAAKYNCWRKAMEEELQALKDNH